MDKMKHNRRRTDKTVEIINNHRDDIDRIDIEILEQINRRLELAQKIGHLKAKSGDQVIDSSRENRLLKRLKQINQGPLNNHSLQHIYTEIIAASREIQTPHRITYLGPEATFTHIAALKHFGRSSAFIPQPSIPDIFNEVEKGAFHYGVVPVENSIEGAVNYTLDLFFESNLSICAEVYYSISHDLLSASGRLADIQVIYSHPQAFAQCRRWLKKHIPDVRLVDCSSTAEAALKSSQEHHAAAIASQEAAESYQLEIVASRIEDTSRNVTRFLVIGRNEIGRTGNDKTSIMFATAHVPGALYQMLRPIAKAGINMVKLESRPTKHENWNYFFFVDLEGHQDDAIVQDTLAEMRALCLFLKVLGSYPRADAEKRSTGLVQTDI